MPLYLLLNKYNAFVQVCFSQTPEIELQRAVENAEIVVSAVGVPALIKSEWLKPD